MEHNLNERNLTMLADFYELTMAGGYFENGLQNTVAYFDMFFRKIPDNGGFAIMAGVEQLIEYLQSLRFSKEDIAYLKEKSYSATLFYVILQIFALPATYGPYRKVRPFSPTNRL